MYLGDMCLQRFRALSVVSRHVCVQQVHTSLLSSLFYVTDEVKYKVSSAMKINGLGAKRLIGL